MGGTPNLNSSQDDFEVNPQNFQDVDRKKRAKETHGAPSVNKKNIDPILMHSFDGDDGSLTDSILDSNTIDEELIAKLKDLLIALDAMTKTKEKEAGITAGRSIET